MLFINSIRIFASRLSCIELNLQLGLKGTAVWQGRRLAFIADEKNNGEKNGD